MSLQGILSLYQIDEHRKRPYFTSADQSSTKIVVFVGGLTNGFLNPAYLLSLSRALGGAGWGLVQMYWTGAYEGYGTGSLDRDRDEMAAMVQHLRDQGAQTIVIMGHSTGSQDVMHYLSSPLSSTSSRPRVEGGIMQAPLSDRAYFMDDDSPGNEIWKDRLLVAEQLIAEGKGEQVLDKEFCDKAGCPMSAYRLHSLVGIGGDDDYFSDDLPLTPSPGNPHKHPLSTSFGAISAPALVLYSEKDEYDKLADINTTMKRWEEAGRGHVEYRILRGANHAVTEEAPQRQLSDEVVGWLARRFG